MSVAREHQHPSMVAHTISRSTDRGQCRKQWGGGYVSGRRVHPRRNGDRTDE